MRAERIEPADVAIFYQADICFIGQSYALEISFDPESADLAKRLYEDFLVAHERVYGHAVRVPAKIVGIRTIHQAGGSETIRRDAAGALRKIPGSWRRARFG